MLNYLNLIRATEKHTKQTQADLIATLFDDLQNVWRQGILLPVADGVGDLSSFGRDAVVLSEDSPVSVYHLLHLLLRPVPVVPALLGLLLSDLLQPQSEKYRKCKSISIKTVKI